MQPIGARQAFLRGLVDCCLAVFSLPILLSYLWPLWDGRKQIFADKAVSSVVIRDVR